MLEIFGRLSSALFKIPQHKNSDGTLNVNYEEQSILWRLRVAGAIVVLGAIVLGLVGFAALSLGVIGNMGFARAAEVSEVRADLIAQRIEKIDRAMCMERQIDQELVNLRRELQDEYRKLKGEFYDVPRCEVLLKIQ